MAGQGGCIADTGAKGSCGNTFLGTNNTHDLQLFPIFHQFAHICLVLGHILPDTVLAVEFVFFRCVDQSEPQSHQVIIGPFQGFSRVSRFFALHDKLHHLIQRLDIPQAKCIGHIVSDLMRIRQHHDQLIIFLRPTALKNLVLGIQHIHIVDHFREDIGVHIGGHGRTSHQFSKERAGIDLQHPIGSVIRENQRLHTITVLYRIDGLCHLINIFFHICLEGSQIIGTDLRKHLGDHLLFNYSTILCVLRFCDGNTHSHHGRSHIRSLRLNGQGVVGKGIFLDLINITLKAGRQGKNQRNTDDTDRACKGS